METLVAMLSGPILPQNWRLGLSIRLDRHRYLPHSRPRTPYFGAVNGASSSFPDANGLNPDNFLGSITTEKDIDNTGQSSKSGRQKHISGHLTYRFLGFPSAEEGPMSATKKLAVATQCTICALLSH